MNTYNKVLLDTNKKIKFSINTNPRKDYADHGEKGRVTAFIEDNWFIVQSVGRMLYLSMDEMVYISDHMPSLMGTAICSCNDEFDEDIGKDLAAKRLYKLFWNNFVSLYQHYIDLHISESLQKLKLVDSAAYCANHELEYAYNKIMDETAISNLDNEEIADEISEAERE